VQCDQEDPAVDGPCPRAPIRICKEAASGSVAVGGGVSVAALAEYLRRDR
jgi:hypothetical protein